MGYPGTLVSGQTFHVALDEAKALTTALTTGFEQQLKTKADAEQWTVVPVPTLEIWDQTRRQEILHGWIKRSDARQDEGIAAVETFRTRDLCGLMTKAIKGLLHGVEIAHAVINQTEIESQSAVPQ